MNATVAPLLLPQEHLTPHDLVTYSRCPFEMELQHRLRAAQRAGAPVIDPPLSGGAPLRHSPLFLPPQAPVRVNDGRLDLFDSDLLVYEDEGEDDLPVLFPPERVRPDPQFRRHGVNLLDDEFGLSGRPDYILSRAGGAFVPVEYKATHLFLGWKALHLENHGRAFDLLQAIAECRLVHAVSGVRPPYGIVLYGDRGEDGEHEGWVEVPYGEREEHWLKAALTQIRTDRERSPVPTERNCAPCEPNRDGHCRFAAVRPNGTAHPP
ncbi:MAG TPA: hypothetical protein VFG07_04800 [Thermoplasmata archaeon]|nr:hypothetical protein [Thermoplasmata archaeon]